MFFSSVIIVEIKLILFIMLFFINKTEILGFWFKGMLTLLVLEKEKNVFILGNGS